MSDDLDFLSASAQLGAVEQLDVPSMELLYRLECSGEDFYNTLADRIGNDDAADLLRRNGREELGHANRIKRAIAIKVGADYEPSGSALEKLPIALPETISVDLLPLVVQGELDGNAGYQKWADNEPDADVARLLRLNGREEVKHGERVIEAIALMKAGAADAAHGNAQGDVPEGVGPEVFRERLEQVTRDGAERGAHITLDDSTLFVGDIESIESEPDTGRSRVRLRNGIIIGGLTGAAIVAALATVRFRRRHHQ